MSIAWPSLPGLHDCEFELAEGVHVGGTLALPSGPTAGAPLVLCLHYGGRPVGAYGRPLLEQLVEPAWRTLGAVLIAPVARHGDWTNPGDTASTLALLDELARHYGCGPRIVTGYSLGAIGTWHLLAECPDAFAAAVPIAGPPPAVPGGTTPVRALNSTADQRFPARLTVASVQALAAAGRDAACELIGGVEHYDFSGFACALAVLVPWLAQRCACAADGG